MTSEERSEAEEIIRLKKELAKAKAENEFLKKGKWSEINSGKH